MLFCKYKNIFGAPNTGAHSYRIFGLAAVDMIGTILIAYFLSLAYKKNFLHVFLGVFIFGEVLHVLFCVDTAFLRMIRGAT
jgi:hypothetical protein